MQEFRKVARASCEEALGKAKELLNELSDINQVLHIIDKSTFGLLEFGEMQVKVEHGVHRGSTFPVEKIQIDNESGITLWADINDRPQKVKGHLL